MLKNQLSSSTLCRQSKHAPQNSVLSLPMPALTPSTRWPCYCSSNCVLGQQRKRNERNTVYAVAAELRASYQKNLKKTGTTTRTSTYELLLLLQQLAVKKYTWLHCSSRKHFQARGKTFFSEYKFQRRGRDGRRYRKLLSLCHNHQ